MVLGHGAVGVRAEQVRLSWARPSGVQIWCFIRDEAPVRVSGNTFREMLGAGRRGKRHG